MEIKVNLFKINTLLPQHLSVFLVSQPNIGNNLRAHPA